MKKNVQIRFAIIALTFILAVLLSGAVSAADTTNNDSGTNILEKNATTNTSFSNSLNTSNNTSSNASKNKSAGLNGSKQVKFPDPQIWRNGAPVSRGGHPAGYVYSSIAAAIADAQNGDTIMLENGVTFNERITVNKDLTFAVFDNGRATINGNDGGRVVTITNDRTVTFTGIKFIGGKINGNGGAIYNNGDGRLTLTDCTFINNNAWYGGAVYSQGPLTMIGCNLQGNTADLGMGGAVFAANRNSVLNYNRFIGNTQTQVWKTGTNDIDARYNWWGSNNGPTSSIVAWNGDVHNADYSPWTRLLSISASPGTIYNGQQSTVTAQFSYNVPKDMPVSFSFQGSPLGTLSINPAYANNGIATTTFTANTVGTSHVLATADSYTVGPANIVINNPIADVVMTKHANGNVANANVNVGQTGTFTITVTNNGPCSAQNVVVHDPLPAGFSYTASAGTSYNPSTGDWTIGTLASGSTVTLTFSGVITAAMAGSTITNTATETQSTTDPTPVTSQTASIYVPKSNVEITKMGNGPVNVGDTGTFTITVTNKGPNTAHNVVVHDPLPAGFSYTASAGTSYNPSTGDWTIGTLAKDSTATLTLSGVITAAMAGSTITNTATETQDEYTSLSQTATASIRVLQSDLTISKTVDNVAHPGQTINYQDNIRYTLTVNNGGPDAAQNVVIKDKISNLLNFNPASVTSDVAFTYDWDSINRIFTAYLTNPLNSGATAHLYLPAQVLAHNQQVDNTANVTTTTYDPTTPDVASTGFFVPAVAHVVLNTYYADYNQFVNNNHNIVPITTANYLQKVIVILTATNVGPDPVTYLYAQYTWPSGLTGSNEYWDSPNAATWNFIIWSPSGDSGWYPTNVATLNSGDTFLTAIGAVVNVGSGIITNTITTQAQTPNDPTGYDSASANLIANVAPTSLSVNSPNGYNGDTVPITATLKDSNGNPLSGKLVTITVNGQSSSGNTDTNGQFTWQFAINGMNTGTYDITVAFAGDNLYAASSSTGTLTVNAISTSLTVNPASGYKGDSISLTAKLWDTVHDKAVAGKIVKFYVNGVYIDSGTTGDDGVATCDYIITQGVGSYPGLITAEFAADNQYAGNNGANDLTVNAIPTSLTVNSITGNKGETVNLKAKLWDTAHDKAVAGKIVKFYVNGALVGSGTTDASGVATLSYCISLVGGTYDIDAAFAADDQYSVSTGKGTLKVPQSSVYVLTKVSQNDPAIGDIVKITFKLGNNGPDGAENVIFIYVIPNGLKLVDISGDGVYLYDADARTIIWNVGDVPANVDPYLYVLVKPVHAGIFNIDPDVSTITYDPDLSSNIQAVTFNVAKPNVVKPKVNAASKTIPLQHTGLPLAGFALAVLAIVGGLVPKRKN